jgi:methylmalonyl-CoA mutase cobalamin-binding subunit
MLRRPRAGWRVLLATLPTEQHSLGLHMVAESFRAAGWDVTLEIAVANADLVGLVGGSAFAVIGFSLGRHSHAGELALTIRAIRKVSANPHIGVMVGGPAFLARPDLVRGVGADFTASCAGEAVARADALRAMLAAADNSMTSKERRKVLF